MPRCEGRFFREPDGQYTWLYFKDNKFVDVGGANLTLSVAFNGIRDRIAAEPNVELSESGVVIVDVPNP